MVNLYGLMGNGNFDHVPDPHEPPSDEWFEEHCPRCKHNHEWQEDGKWYGECKNGCCEFEEVEEE